MNRVYPKETQVNRVRLYCARCFSDFYIIHKEKLFLHNISITWKQSQSDSHVFSISDGVTLEPALIDSQIGKLKKLVTQRFKGLSSNRRILLEFQKISPVEIFFTCALENSVKQIALSLNSNRDGNSFNSLYSEIFKKLSNIDNMKICAAFGTLLGLTRENKLINWDNDIDFWILITKDELIYKSLWKEIETAFSKDGFTSNIKNNFSVTFRNALSGAVIDLYFLIEFQNSWLGYLIYPTEISAKYFNALNETTNPPDPENILEEIYGINWQKPDPSFKHKPMDIEYMKLLSYYSEVYFRFDTKTV